MMIFDLKKKRQELGLSLRDLALNADVSFSLIGKIERRDLVPSRCILKKISLALKINEEECLIAYGYLPPYTTEAREKNPKRINKVLKKAIERILMEGEGEGEGAMKNF